MHLKRSNGSRQSRQRCSALHGVEPNSLIVSVLAERHRGQTTMRLVAAALHVRADAAAGDGGMMPYCSSLRRPSGVIQSLLQAGASTGLTENAPTPASSSARRASSAM